MRAHHRAIIDWLDKHGAAKCRLETGTAHPRIVFQWEGVERSYVTSGTPSDTVFAAFNAVRDIRHMLGLVSGEKRVRPRRVRQQRRNERAVRRPIVLHSITPGRDWAVALEGHVLMPAVLDLRLDRAFVDLWRDCMASVGARSRLGETP